MVLFGFLDDQSLVEKQAEIVKIRTERVIEITKEKIQILETDLEKAKKTSVSLYAKNKNKSKNPSRMMGGMGMPGMPNMTGSNVGKNNNVKKEFIFTNINEKKKTIEEIEGKLEELKDKLEIQNQELVYGRLDAPFSIDDFGELAYNVKVIDIIDERYVLVVYNGKTSSNLIIDVGSTKNIVDDQVFSLSHIPYMVSKTRTYKTVIGGSNKVFVLEPVDTNAIEKILMKK